MTLDNSHVRLHDKRINEVEIADCDFNLMSRLAKLYHRTNLNLLVKLIEKEFQCQLMTESHELTSTLENLKRAERHLMWVMKGKKPS